mmetsp:Transcript_62257/g.148584  ORF Transcript_62257/g.148584 Transcript_62257/m.148584 type:complete len:84 (-) Transcript_62257:1355-1606(-)
MPGHALHHLANVTRFSLPCASPTGTMPLSLSEAEAEGAVLLLGALGSAAGFAAQQLLLQHLLEREGWLVLENGECTAKVRADA